MTATQLPDLDRECGTCEGSGIVTSTAWLDYDKTARQARAEWEAAHPGESWWASDEGVAVEDGYPEDPEAECGECRGAGRVPTDAGRQILTFLQNMQRRPW